MNQTVAAQALFPASVVGSIPRPRFVRDLVMGADRGQEYTRAMDAAVQYVVAMQEKAGLDVVTDGEWRRASYIGVIAELASGFEVGTNPADGRPWTIVTGKVKPRGGGFVAREVEFLKKITSKQIKATLPAPALLGERMWNAEQSAAAYPRLEDFVRDCAVVLNEEARRLRDAGADIVQIDDPHLCLFVDEQVRSSYDDPTAASDFAVEMTNQVVQGIQDVKFAVHLCRRAGARARGEARHRGGYEAIVDQLNRLNVRHLTMEFTAPESGDMRIFEMLRPDFEIGLGCVSTTPGQIDSTQAIVERVEKALHYLSADRITLNPDCGFAPGSAAKVDLDEVYEKLQHEAEASRILRERHGGGK
jgi:5-methyltetrahydropteroyltriglutamate--homocysteine methyltransferase